MRIDTAQVGNAKVFRPWGWSIALIVSEDIKQALERIKATGVKFAPVKLPPRAPCAPLFLKTLARPEAGVFCLARTTYLIGIGSSGEPAQT